MGRDKAFLGIYGAPLIARQLESLRLIFKKVLIVTNTPERYAGFKQARVTTDVIPGMGPLGGIHSGLLTSGTFHNFVIACDMPFINMPFVTYMLNHRDNYDILIPKIAAKVHPLFGIYSKKCIPVVEEALRENRLKVAGIFSKVKTRFLSGAEIRRFDKDMLSLVNVNTPEDLERVKERKG